MATKIGIDEHELTRWINTEGILRLEAMKSDPAQCLTHDEFWATLEDDDQDIESAIQKHKAA